MRFLLLVVTAMVKKYQEQYYKAIALCDAKGNSTEFITFMLRCILETTKQEIKVTDKVMDKVTDKSDDKILTLIRNNPSITIPEMMSTIPRRIIQAFGGKKKAQIVTAPNTSKIKPMSLVPLYIL